MADAYVSDPARRTYYVAVGAKQVLEDPKAAAFEFSIRANDEELNKLVVLFDEIQDSDEDNAFHFSGWPSVSDDPENATYNALFKDIYQLLYELGTSETKRHIETLNIIQ